MQPNETSARSPPRPGAGISNLESTKFRCTKEQVSNSFNERQLQ